MMEALVYANTELRDELDSVKIYLEHEARRHEGKLVWTCSVEDGVDARLIIPKRLIGIFVENAIEEGLIRNGNGGRIEISVHNTSLGMLIMVHDEGIHFQDISSIRERREKRFRKLDKSLDRFNESHSYRIHYDLLDRSFHDSDKTGSRVLITVQFQ